MAIKSKIIRYVAGIGEMTNAHLQNYTLENFISSITERPKLRREKNTCYMDNKEIGCVG
jgi:hypothetical protein